MWVSCGQSVWLLSQAHPCKPSSTLRYPSALHQATLSPSSVWPHCLKRSHLSTQWSLLQCLSEEELHLHCWFEALFSLICLSAISRIPSFFFSIMTSAFWTSLTLRRKSSINSLSLFFSSSIMRDSLSCRLTPSFYANYDWDEWSAAVVTHTYLSELL